MSPVIISADPSVHEDSGKVAVMRGPVVYCAEGVDNGDIFSLAVSPELNAEPVDLGFGIPALDVDGTRKFGAGALYAPADETKYEPARIRLIPYFALGILHVIPEIAMYRGRIEASDIQLLHKIISFVFLTKLYQLKMSVSIKRNAK